MNLECGPRRADPVPHIAARGCLPLYASFKLSGHVDPYLSSEPHDWRHLNPGSVESQSPTASNAPGDTQLFATGTLEIFQDLSTYCQHWGSCQHCTSMGNTASTSCSATVGELNTPDIGGVNVFEFIGSANDNINHFGDAFSPEVLDAFLNTAGDIEIVKDEQVEIDNSAGLSPPSHDLGLVEHEEVVGECDEITDPLSCNVQLDSVSYSVKSESVSDSASVAACDETMVDDQCVNSRSPISMGHELTFFKDLPAFLPEQNVDIAKPKLDLSLILDPTFQTDNVIGTPEVLQLLCEADVNYDWLNYQGSPEASEVSQSSMVAELQHSLEERVPALEETNDQVTQSEASSEAAARPVQRVSRKRRVVVEAPAPVTPKVEPQSPAPAKRSRHAGQRPRLSTSTEEDICQKYRELRDRNNEASRRSRLNRKTQDEEMMKSAEQLESENEKLRTKVEELEKLRDKVKEALFRIVKGNNSS